MLRLAPRLLVLAACCIAAAAGFAPPATAQRRIGWWWDAPTTTHDPSGDPSVAALLKFVTENTGIVSSVMMQCGPTTKSGKLEGALSPACATVIPQLTKLGVGSELW